MTWERNRKKWLRNDRNGFLANSKRRYEMTKLGTKWVRNYQTGYEMTKLKIEVGTK